MDLKECLPKVSGVYTSLNNTIIRYCLEASQNMGKPEIQNLLVTGHPFMCLWVIGMYKARKINDRSINKKNLEGKL